MSETEIVKLIEDDDWMMRVLKTARQLNLPDWWIGAGFVRSKVWDALHGYQQRTLLPDVDVIYLNKKEYDKDLAAGDIKQSEKKYEMVLENLMPGIKWSVKNQARMHLIHGHEPYTSCKEALAQWVETATCVAVKLHDDDKVEICAPRGINDLVNLILRPTTPGVREKFYERIHEKKWLEKWPKLKILGLKALGIFVLFCKQNLHFATN